MKRTLSVRVLKSSVGPAARWLGDTASDMAAYANVERPRTRDECVDGPRPCPYVGCRFNTFLDVNARGGIRLAHPGREPWEVPAATSCALDVAAAHPGGAPLPLVASVIGTAYDRGFATIEEARKHAIALAGDAGIIDDLRAKG